MSDAFINAVASFLPGDPVDNDGLERVLGELPGGPSRLKSKILRNNGITTRHYAYDPDTGEVTHNAAQLAAEAIRAVADKAAVAVEDIDTLACGISLPEHLTPGHASSVHGELGTHPCEIVSTHGVCCAGVTALKYAAMAVKTGDAKTAVATGTERASSLLHARHFRAELEARQVDEGDPHIAFDQEFLRYMLSDGSGAALVQDQPRGLSLRVDWIDLVSFAHELPTCMYMGAQRTPDGGLRGYRDAGTLEDALKGGYFNLHQDVKVLGRNIVQVSTTKTLEILRERRGFSPDQIDWVVPHYSSEFFRQRSYDELVACGFEIPYSKWCSTLTTRGNTGCASVLIMLNDLLESGRVEPGHRVVLMVPESGRFSAAWAMLTAVEA